MTCDKARVKLICIGHAQETPTSDAAKLHTMRSHYQDAYKNVTVKSYNELKTSVTAVIIRR